MINIKSLNVDLISQPNKDNNNTVIYKAVLTTTDDLIYSDIVAYKCDLNNIAESINNASEKLKDKILLNYKNIINRFSENNTTNSVDKNFIQDQSSFNDCNYTDNTDNYTNENLNDIGNKSSSENQIEKPKNIIAYRKRTLFALAMKRCNEYPNELVGLEDNDLL